MQISFNGIYLYANIGGPFLPHREVNKQWQVIGNGTNLAIIQLDFTDQIIDIEAFDYTNASSNNYINPYPMKMFLIRSKDVQQNFIFVTHRSNDAVDRTGGIYITYLNDSSAAFFSYLPCLGIGCSRCSGKIPSLCQQCMSIY